MTRVSRGLLHTENGLGKALRPSDPMETTMRVLQRLQGAPGGDYAWRERVDWAARLYRGDGDERGRRLFTEAGRMDARYVARVSRRAYHHDVPSTKVAWGHLRESLYRIFTELGGGA